MSDTHHHRDVAESFGSNAQRYNHARPRYPQAMIDRIVKTSPGPDFLDVGCGTGIAARQFQSVGCNVVGVDVDARMADVPRNFGLNVEVSKFEEWNASGRTFDAVISGQTWHWIDPVAGAHKAAEVLHPGGTLAIFWNAAQPPTELNEKFAAAYKRVMPDSIVARGSNMSAVDGYSSMCSRAADGMRQAGGFDEAAEWRFEWDRTYTRDEWLELVPTTGDHSQFPQETLDELLTEIGNAIDAVGGSFVVAYTALVTVATRHPRSVQ